MLKATNLLKNTQEEKGTEISSDNLLEKLGSMLLEWTFNDPVQSPCRNPKSRLKPTHLRTDTTACHRSWSLSFRECDYLNAPY